MTCIYTGAVVHILNNDATLVCDLHQVGNVIIANEGKDAFDYREQVACPWTHVIVLGTNAYVSPNCIAAPALLWVPYERAGLLKKAYDERLAAAMGKLT